MKGFFKRVLKGGVQLVGRLADGLLTGGAIHNIIEETKIKKGSTNEIIKESVKGKIDLPKWFAMLIISIPFWIVLAVIFGAITPEDAIKLLKLF